MGDRPAAGGWQGKEGGVGQGLGHGERPVAGGEGGGTWGAQGLATKSAIGICWPTFKGHYAGGPTGKQ